MGTFWKLENVEQAAAQNPETFFISPSEDRKNQEIGDAVRLHYLLKERQDDEPSGERMWITVTQECGLFKSYKGTLQSQPVYIDDINQGDEIAFKPHHIARTIIKKGDARWIDSTEDKALVSEMCFAKGECVRFLYRQDADNDEDSGWRMFSGKETDEYTDDPTNIRLPEVGWMLDRDPTLLGPLKEGVGAAFERESVGAEWRKVKNWQPDE